VDVHISRTLICARQRLSYRWPEHVSNYEQNLPKSTWPQEPYSAPWHLFWMERSRSNFLMKPVPQFLLDTLPRFRPKGPLLHYKLYECVQFGRCTGASWVTFAWKFSHVSGLLCWKICASADQITWNECTRILNTDGVGRGWPNWVHLLACVTTGLSIVGRTS